MAAVAIAVVTGAIQYVWNVFAVLLDRTGMRSVVLASIVALLAVLKLLTPVVGSGAGSDSLFHGHAGRLNAPKKSNKESRGKK